MYILHIVGKDVIGFIKSMNKIGIDFYYIDFLNYKEVTVKVSSSDFKRLSEIKTTYEINVVKTTGLLNIKNKIKKNMHLIVLSFLGYIIIFVLSSMIFKIEIVHNDKEIREILLNELESYGIKKYGYKKNFKNLKEIEEKIIDDHKEKIEWLEISEEGTKYIVRVEQRLIEKEDIEVSPRHIISKKNAVIKYIEAKNGEIIKDMNEYVKKGDIIISGEIMKNEEVVGIVRASGEVYGEVWYQVNVKYPLNYKEEIKTNISKYVLSIDFLNKKYNIFDFSHYKDAEIVKRKLLSNSLLPFSFNLNKETKLIIIDESYTVKEALEKAVDEAYEKINSKLSGKEKILKQNTLKFSSDDSTIDVVMYFSVLENITDELLIPEL